MSSSIFKGNIKYWHLNACVGNNGWTGMSTYLEGYQAATIAMLESILHRTQLESSDSIFWTYDTAIYPIIFTARHSFELFLKSEISNINLFKKNIPPIKNQLTITHNIGKLWLFFKEQISLLRDYRLNYIIPILENTIEEYNRIDPNGEVFRYPYNNQGNKHLEEHYVINIYEIYKNYIKFSNHINDFQLLTEYLYKEYEVGTYTDKLSRNDLEFISKILPLKVKWRENQFITIKNYIKNKYSLSNNELSRAIKKIENHYEFSLKIIKNNYLININKNILVDYCNGNFTYNNLKILSTNDLIILKSLVDCCYIFPFFSEWIDIFINKNKQINIMHEINYIHKNYPKVKKLIIDQLNYDFIF